MKAFIAQNKHKTQKHEKDCLVLASSKKESLTTFDSFIGGFQYSSFLKKDFIEVEKTKMDLNGMDIYPGNLERYDLASCFEFHVSIKTEPYSPHVQQLISEDDKTTKEFIKIFKTENADFFKKYI